MKRFAWILCGAVGLALSYVPVGCSSDEHSHASGPTDAIYLGDATDEGLSAFDAATPTTDAAKAPALTSPTAGQKVPAGTPIAFNWKASPTGALDLDLLRDPGRAPARTYEGSAPFGAMRAAHAHGDPMNGKAYLLTLKSNGATVVRVFTSNTTYTPDDEAWSKLKDAKTIEAVLATAQYDNNNIVQGSGPFVAPGVAFTIE